MHRASRTASRRVASNHNPSQCPEWSERWRQVSAARSACRSLDRDALYAQFQPLVDRLMRRHAETKEQREDLKGKIYLRFCELVEAYDPGRGVPLRPYLVRMLTASTGTGFRTLWGCGSRELSLEAGFARSEAAGEDPVSAWDGSLLSQGTLAALPARLAKRSDRQMRVVIGRYYEGRSFEELAGELHVRPAMVRSLLRRGLNRLRRELGACEAGAAED